MSINNNINKLKKRSKSISGKSGAFFYFTKDKKLILKSVTADEADVLKLMIKDYAHRLISTTHSYLARIYGAFKLSVAGSEPIIIIIMENLSRCFKNPLMFDLKGSTHERRESLTKYKDLDAMDRSRVYKDEDFMNCIQTININSIEAEKIFKSLELDTKLLETYEIMDYSMLVLFQETNSIENSPQSEIYNNFFRFGDFSGYVGVIDYFQTFTIRKKLENKFNQIKANNFSCIPPFHYRKRFLNMIANILNITL